MSAINVSVPGIPFTNLASTDTYATLRLRSSAALTQGTDIVVNGSTAVGDGGGGLFTWDALSILDDNGSSVIKPADRITAGRWKTVGGSGSPTPTPTPTPFAAHINGTAADIFLITQADGDTTLNVNNLDAFAHTGVATKGQPRIRLGGLADPFDDAALSIGREVTGTALFSHMIQDNSKVTIVSGAYASYDTVATINGAVNYGHAYGFENRMIFIGIAGTGTLHSGFLSQPTVVGGEVNYITHHQARDTIASGGAKINVQAGFWCDTMSAGVANYGIYVEGNDCFFGKAIRTIGRATIDAAIRVGTLADPGDDAAISVGRNLTGATVFPHCMQDNSSITLTVGSGYASYDALPQILGSGTYSHEYAFQNRTIFNLSGAGNCGTHIGFFSQPTLQDGTIDEIAHFRCTDVIKTAGAVVTTEYGLHVNKLSEGVSNFGVYVADNNSYMGGDLQISGDFIGADRVDVGASLRIGFSAASAAAGTIVRKVAVSDIAGTPLGFLHIHDA